MLHRHAIQFKIKQPGTETRMLAYSSHSQFPRSKLPMHAMQEAQAARSVIDEHDVSNKNWTGRAYRPVPIDLDTTSFLNVFLGSGFVLRSEVLVGVTSQPLGELGQLLAHAVNRLLVHVCLRNKTR